MRKVDVEIADDQSRPEGGYAIVLLRGVTSLPDRASFRVKPVDARDASAGPAGEEWPRGEHVPVAVRQTDAGIELVIGPEIVECAALLPGTVGVIEIPAADVRGEFLWPSIRPTARPRRRHNLSVVKPARAMPVVPQTVVPKPAMPKPAVIAAQAVATSAADALPPVMADAATNPPPIPAPGVALAKAVASHLAEASPADGTEAKAPLAALNRSRTTEPPAIESPGSTVTSGASHAIVSGEPPATSPATAIAPNAPLQPVTPPSRPIAVSRSADDEANAAPPFAASPTITPVAFERVHGLTQASRRIALIAACATAVLLGGYLVTGFYSSSAHDTSASAEAKTTGQRSAAVPTGQNPTRPSPPPPITVARVATVTPAPAAESATESATDASVAASAVAALATAPSASPNQIQDPASTAAEAPAANEPQAVAKAEPPAPKSEVTLRIRGGGFQVTGELRGFDGTKYVIATKSSGVMTMDASRFECQGETCSKPAAAILPMSERPNPLKPDRVAIEATSTFTPEFLPQLIKSYAASIAATATEISGSKYRISDARGAELATIEIADGVSPAPLGSPEPGSAALAFTERSGGDDARGVGGAATRQESDARPAAAGAKRAQTTAEQLIGFDGVAVIASPNAQIASLSLDMLAKLFSGQATDWFELGVEPGTITLYMPPEGSGTADAFNRLVMRPRGLKLTAGVTQLRTDAEVAAAVARDPHGVGLVSFSAMHAAKPLNLETQCGLITRPSAFAVKTEEYPLTRRLYLATGLAPTQPAARGLIRMATASEAQRTIAAARLVDLSLTALPLAGHSERMASAINAPAAAFDISEMRQMLTDLAGYSRVSTALRFNSAGELDARSKKEIARVAALLKEPAFAGRKVQLAGFTDAGAKFQASLTIGLKRAGQVRAALLAAGGPSLNGGLLNTRGYGSLAPIACNTTADGQRLNRRVEVWITDDARRVGSAGEAQINEARPVGTPAAAPGPAATQPGARARSAATR